MNDVLIKQALLDAGWQITDIQAAVDDIDSVTLNMRRKKTLHSLFIAIFIVLIVSSYFVSAKLYFHTWPFENIENVSVLTPSPTPTPTSSPTVSPTPGPTPVILHTPALIPSITPPSLTTATATPSPALESTTKVPNFLGNITIEGDEDCISKTQEALKLLQDKAVVHYSVINKYVGVIECTESGSGMDVWAKPPKYQVGKPTRDAGTIWYAGTIAHDACHSKLYHDYLSNNPSNPVPYEIWTGRNAEKQCLDVQYDALTKIGADYNALNYVKSIINSEYWNIDYDKRWW